MSNVRNTIVGVSLGAFAMTVWASWMIANRWGVTSSLSIWDITALRLAASGLLMLPIALRHGLAPGRIAPGFKGVRLLVGMIAGAGIVYQLVSISGFAFVPISHGSVMLPGTMPLFVALFSFAILGERFAPSRLVGFALLPLGVLCLAWVGFMQGEPGEWRGQALFVFSAFLWAIYTLCMRASGMTAIDATAQVCVWSAILYLPFYAIFGGDGISRTGWVEIAVQVVVQGVLSGVVALVAYNRALQLLGASRGAALSCLMPVIGTLLAIPVLGEWPAPLDWLGVAVIGAGVYLAAGGPVPTALQRAPA